MVRKSSCVLALTDRHKRLLTDTCPDHSSRIHLISRNGLDINDPFGGPVELYRQCAAQIAENLRLWLPDLLRKDS
jgi:protein-tyrosine phosphatase